MTSITDRKKITYADYLKIDEKVIEIFILEKEGYVEFCKSKKKGMVKSNILEGLEIDSKDVFE